jgi:hypothetical protein
MAKKPNLIHTEGQLTDKILELKNRYHGDFIDKLVGGWKKS